MKWVLSQQSVDHHRWLLQDTQEQAHFTYHAQLHSIRIKAKNNRLFFLEVTGFLQKKIQLLSEYGVVLGEAYGTQPLKNGLLIIDGQKCLYRWANGRLCLYNKNKTLLTETDIEFSEGTDLLEQFALVFSTAWIAYSNKKSLEPEALLMA